MVDKGITSSGPAFVVGPNVYRDTAGEWRWQVRAKNDKIVADSGEGYTRRVDCLKGLSVLKAILAGRVVKVHEVTAVQHPSLYDPH